MRVNQILQAGVTAMIEGAVEGQVGCTGSKGGIGQSNVCRPIVRWCCLLVLWVDERESMGV